MSKKAVESSTSKEKSPAKEESLERKLIENLVELQKVHTNLAEKFDKLSSQITNLLALFELAARSFAQNPANINNEKDKEFLDKIDKLLDQNKTLAKGLTLMEERMRERVYGNQPSQQAHKENNSETEEDFSQPAPTRPLPRF